MWESILDRFVFAEHLARSVMWLLNVLQVRWAWYLGGSGVFVSSDCSLIPALVISCISLLLCIKLSGHVQRPFPKKGILWGAKCTKTALWSVGMEVEVVSQL